MNRIIIKEESKEALVGHRLMLFFIILIASLLSAALSPLGIGFLLAPLLYVGLFLIIKDMLKKKEIDVNRFLEIFKDLNHALKVIGVSFLTGIFIIVGLIVFIIPGIYFALAYSQAVFIMEEKPHLGIWDAMEESKRMMSGKKMDLLVFYLSFILHFLLCGITFGLYGIYFLPYYHTCIANYYMHLKKEDNMIID